jgi:Sec-independent protein secretion pathway component TatC
LKKRVDMKEMTLLEHLRELKDRVKVSLIAVIISTLAMLVFPAEFNLSWGVRICLQASSFCNLRYN